MTDQLAAASAAHAELAAIEETLAAVRQRRDDAIRAAVADGASAYQVAKTLGLAQTTVAYILGRRESNRRARA